jgi:hypothetical protein
MERYLKSYLDEAIGVILVVIVIAIVVFLIAREIVCWYWKINRAITLLESINEQLGDLNNASVIMLLESINQQFGRLATNRQPGWTDRGET